MFYYATAEKHDMHYVYAVVQQQQHNYTRPAVVLVGSFSRVFPNYLNSDSSRVPSRLRLPSGHVQCRVLDLWP